MDIKKIFTQVLDFIIKSPFCVIFLIVLASFFLNSLIEPSRIVSKSYYWLGFFMFLSGFGILLMTFELFSKSETSPSSTVRPNRLIIVGPFQYSRNPMYLGVIVALVGLAIILGTLPFFLSAVILFFILDRKYIPQEEEALNALFGEKYQEYFTTVRRWIWIYKKKHQVITKKLNPAN